MTARRFSTGSRFQWQGRPYEVRRLLAENKVNIANLETGEVETVVFAQLYRDLLNGRLAFLDQKTNQVRPQTAVDWRDISEEHRRIAEYRLEVIAPLLEIPASERKTAVRQRVAEYQQRFAGQPKTMQTTISEASVYRWLRTYGASGHDIRALLPNLKNRGNRTKVRIEAETNQIIETTIDDLAYLREKRSIDYIHREVTLRVNEENRSRPPTEQLSLPSRPTVARRIQNRDSADLLIAKRGKREAEKELAQVGAMVYPNFALERVEMDHTRTDLIVIDDVDLLPLGRLTLTYCLETHTRYPLGYYMGFDPPSYLTVMECLYHAIMPKENVREQYGTVHDWQAYGIPYTLVIDNGREFIGQDLEDACLLLGINLERMPVATPEFKATVERMFGTVNEGLLHTVSGTSFSNIWQRGDYDSLKNACVTLDTLKQILHIHMLDIYAENFHRGLQGVPARRWEALTSNGFFPRVPQSGDELRILLGRVIQRTIQRSGIEFKNLRYNCQALGSLRVLLKKRGLTSVKCKYHPGDMSRIYVFHPFEERYIEVPALAQSYTQGLSLWKHEVISNYARKHSDTVDIAALGAAQRKIQEIVDHSLNQKTSRTRAKEARWQRSGVTSVQDNAEQIQPAATAPSEANKQAEPIPLPIAKPEPVSVEEDEFAFDLEALTAAGWSVTNSETADYSGYDLDDDLQD